MKTILDKYAELLVNYCVDVQPKDSVYIRTSTLAEPLVRAIFREVLKAGGYPVFDLEFEGQHRLFMEYANEDQLQFVNPLQEQAMETYQCYISIMAPHNMAETAKTTTERSKIHQAANSKIHQAYFKRTATRELKRTLCQYPTRAAAQNAGMSLDEYEDFVFNACHLYADDPKAEWLKVRHFQQQIVDKLNQCTTVQYKSDQTDITFSTAGRTWINSDGQTNMPSGEVYTSPVEDSVNGVIHFDYPMVRMGQTLAGVTLWVENGEVQRWEAKEGKEVLDKVFQIEGARRFGEAAIGTNRQINRLTKNILFDEKIGGTVHMAIGQSYLQAGGKNESPIHWDMLADMTHNNGKIFADGELIYENGAFLIEKR